MSYLPAMTQLVLAVVVFIVTHGMPAVRPLRAALIAGLGKRLYMVVYSAVSLAVIVWLGVAYARAPYVPLWENPDLRWVPVVVMPFACILFVGALSSPNPLSIARRKPAYDAARPGIVSVTRHPLMWAFALWAGAHVTANGDAASLILFGLLLVLALAGPMSLDARRRRALGDEEWTRLAAPTSNLPLAAALAGRNRLDFAGIGLGRTLGGLALYAALLFAHPYVIGVPAWPL